MGAEVPGYGRVWPLRSQAVHGERHEVLRVGERHGPLQVHGHDPGQRGGRVEEEQLPPEVGGLSVYDSCGCTAGAASSVCHVSPGGRVSESERFFLRRHFSIFFLVFKWLRGEVAGFFVLLETSLFRSATILIISP